MSHTKAIFLESMAGEREVKVGAVKGAVKLKKKKL